MAVDIGKDNKRAIAFTIALYYIMYVCLCYEFAKRAKTAFIINKSTGHDITSICQF